MNSSKQTTAIHGRWARIPSIPDIPVAAWSAALVMTILLLLFGGSACDDDGDSGSDASADARGSSERCKGAPPMGECAGGSDLCCDDVIRMMQLECRSGAWSCPVGYNAFKDCCGVGYMCQPYGGGDPPSKACESRCRKRGDEWYCGTSDAGTGQD